jgi:uncharacterized protein
MQFEWDNKKTALNLKNHGVSFAEAETVFGDLSAKMFYDDEHSDNEIREIIIGYSAENRLLAVCLRNPKLVLQELLRQEM